LVTRAGGCQVSRSTQCKAIGVNVATITCCGGDPTGWCCPSSFTPARSDQRRRFFGVGRDATTRPASVGTSRLTSDEQRYTPLVEREDDRATWCLGRAALSGAYSFVGYPDVQRRIRVLDVPGR